MYREHCVGQIAPHALATPDNLVECIAFVLSTIQTPLARGAEYWWNSWCEYVAQKGGKNKSMQTAEQVSAYHAACFGLH